MSRPYQAICTADDPQWLHHRALLVTGSEMSTVLGEAPKWFSQSYEDLVLSKRLGQPNSFPTSRRMWWGSASEQGNVACFTKLTGLRTRPMNVLLASTKARIGCTLDGLVLAPGLDRAKYAGYTTSDSNIEKMLYDIKRYKGLLPIEAKQSDGWPKQIGEWEKGVPSYYWVQVQTQLYCTGLPAGVIFCRLGVADMRAHVVEADDMFFEKMEDSVEEFWKEVRDGR